MRYACTLALVLSAFAANAQTYPAKSVRIIHGYGAGTNIDVGARIYSAELQKRLGQPFVVEARPGASGTIGAKAVIASTPDGYTVYYGPVASFHPVFLKNNAVDAGREMAPVSDLLTSGYDFIVRSSLGIKTFPELVAYSKANPGKLNFGSPAVSLELMLKVLEVRTGLSYTVINFKGGSPVAPLLAGDVDFVLSIVSQYMSQVQSGQVIPMFGTRKSPALPTMPTAAEVGVPNFSAGTTTGMWTVLGTPRDNVNKLNAAFVEMTKTPDLVAQLAKSVGQQAISTTPEEQLRNYDADIRFWKEAAQLAKFEPQ